MVLVGCFIELSFRPAMPRNLRQISVGIRMYADDANDTSPSSAGASYKELVQAYVGLGSSPTNQNELFDCPADTFYYNFTGDDQVSLVPQAEHEQLTAHYSSYIFNVANAFTNASTQHLLFKQAVRLALSFATLKSGSNNAARIPMMATTTNNSIKVNPFELAFMLV
jgi:hypothetical protein